MLNWRKALRTAALALSAMLSSIAIGLDMAVVSKLKPDAYDLGGYIYQLIGRTFESMKSDPISAACVFFVALWLARRYLFHKPKQTGVGEYLLCGFFTLSMLVCAAMRASDSVRILYANIFQLLKSALYVLGMYPLFLCAIRGLNELLHREPGQTRVAVWDRHPFAFPLVVLAICWVGQVALKYPGVINLDVVMPIRQYIGITPRATDFPPLGTLIYGLAFRFGERIGNVNIPYFIIMMTQVIALLLVLCYAMWLIKTRNAPLWVCAAGLFLFAVSPIYIGWAVIIIKDAQYMILVLLMSVLLIEFLCDTEGFLGKKTRWALLAGCSLLMILTRYNGVYVVVPMLLVFLITLLKRRFRLKLVICFAVMSVLVLGASAGINEAVTRSLQLRRINFYDWLSVPFQQTARVAKLHGDTISEQEKDDINTMLSYDEIAELYQPNRADPVKQSVSIITRGKQQPYRYLRVWWKQLLEYPIDYFDAFANMSYFMFDLQSNVPIYNSYADIEEYIYPYAFHEPEFFNRDEIRPLMHYQLALTEWYFRFSDIPFIGWFASMGFCVDVMLAMLYLSYVNRRRRTMLLLIPSVITAVMGMFCPEVYVRYLLPVISSLPLWFGGYFLLGEQEQAGEAQLSS